MNKGLEVIEAHHLFGTPYEQIEVVVHPQSIIHSLIQLCDGATLAHLGYPDMRIPISYALHDPESVDVPIGAARPRRAAAALTFEAVDLDVPVPAPGAGGRRGRGDRAVHPQRRERGGRPRVPRRATALQRDRCGDRSNALRASRRGPCVRSSRSTKPIVRPGRWPARPWRARGSKSNHPRAGCVCPSLRVVSDIEAWLYEHREEERLER